MNVYIIRATKAQWPIIIQYMKSRGLSKVVSSFEIETSDKSKGAYALFFTKNGQQEFQKLLTPPRTPILLDFSSFKNHADLKSMLRSAILLPGPEVYSPSKNPSTPLIDNPKRSWLIWDEASYGLGSSMVMRFIKAFCPDVVAKVTLKAIPDIFRSGKSPLVDLDKKIDIDQLLAYVDQAMVPDGHVDICSGSKRTRVVNIQPIVFYTTDASKVYPGLLARVFILHIAKVG